MLHKDLGFDPGVFAYMPARFDRLRRDEFEFDDNQYGRLGGEARDGASARSDSRDDRSANEIWTKAEGLNLGREL